MSGRHTTEEDRHARARLEERPRRHRVVGVAVAGGVLVLAALALGGAGADDGEALNQRRVVAVQQARGRGSLLLVWPRLASRKWSGSEGEVDVVPRERCVPSSPHLARRGAARRWLRAAAAGRERRRARRGGASVQAAAPAARHGSRRGGVHGCELLWSDVTCRVFRELLLTSQKIR